MAEPLYITRQREINAQRNAPNANANSSYQNGTGAGAGGIRGGLRGNKKPGKGSYGAFSGWRGQSDQDLYNNRKNVKPGSPEYKRLIQMSVAGGGRKLGQDYQQKQQMQAQQLRDPQGQQAQPQQGMQGQQLQGQNLTGLQGQNMPTSQVPVGLEPRSIQNTGQAQQPQQGGVLGDLRGQLMGQDQPQQDQDQAPAPAPGQQLPPGMSGIWQEGNPEWQAEQNRLNGGPAPDPRRGSTDPQYANYRGRGGVGPGQGGGGLNGSGLEPGKKYAWQSNKGNGPVIDDPNYNPNDPRNQPGYRDKMTQQLQGHVQGQAPQQQQQQQQQDYMSPSRGGGSQQPGMGGNWGGNGQLAGLLRQYGSQLGAGPATQKGQQLNSQLGGAQTGQGPATQKGAGQGQASQKGQGNMNVPQYSQGG